MAAANIHSDFGAPENKICHCFHFFPFYFPWSDVTGCHNLSFWMLSFKPAFSLFSFTLIKRLFSSSSLSAFRRVSSAYLRFLIFLLTIWFQLEIHPAQHFSQCTLHASYIGRVTTYSLIVLLFQFWISQLFHVQFCCFLTWIQVFQEMVKVVWYFHFFKNFP